MNSYQSTIPEWESQESQQQGNKAPETQKQDISIIKQLEALKLEVKQQQDKLYKMQHIDADLRDLIVSILNNSIKAEPDSITNVYLRTYALEVSKSFNVELLFVMVMVNKGLSLDQITHIISMQSDMPV